MVAVIGAAVLFLAVNDGKLPLPLAAKPIAVLLFAHVKVAPVVGELNAVAATVVLLQAVLLVIALTVAVGFTVMVKVLESPTHDPCFGVTVIVAVIGLAVVLFVVNAGILPVPLAAKPIPVLLLVQE